MTEYDPTKLGPDEIFLAGRLQVDTALDVLEMTEINPVAQSLLRALRDAHTVVTEPEAQNDLTFYFQGEQAQQMKQDIIASARLAERNQTWPNEKRAAAAGLLSVLGIE